MRTPTFVTALGTLVALLAASTSAGYEIEVRTISSALSEQIAQAGKKSIAVVDFTDLQGNVTELGRFLAEEFSVRLAGAGKGFEVVDRNNLKTILQEHKLQASGIIDPATAKKLGQIAGVDALVAGTMTPFGDSVHVAVKVLDTLTARVIGAASGDIPKTKAIEDLLGRGVGESAGVQGTAVPKAQPRTAAVGKPATKVEDFLFEVQNCLAEGSRLTCSVLVTNAARDRALYIGMVQAGMSFQFTRLVDESGTVLRPATISFGGREDNETVDALLASDVPTKLTLEFREFSSTSSEIALLELACSVGSSYSQQFFRVQLRHIPVGRH